jgi:putative transposase
LRQAGRGDRGVKKNTRALNRMLIIEAWGKACEVLTREEFCRTVGISRTSLWRYLNPESKKTANARVVAKSDAWQNIALQLARQYPTYGYRRLYVLLRNQDIFVGQHCLRRWMRAMGLSQRSPVVDSGRTVGERPAEPAGPNVAWQMDATKIHTICDGWIWQTSVLDVFDRRIVSCVVRKTCRSEDAQDALVRALDASFGCDKAAGLGVIHDRGSQFTSHAFRAIVSRCGAKDVTTAVRHPQSCGRIERFHRTLKEELIWQKEWEDSAEVENAVMDWVRFYNEKRPHSALGYQAPLQFNAAELQKLAA